MVDTLLWGGSARWGVWVRLSPTAQKETVSKEAVSFFVLRALAFRRSNRTSLTCACNHPPNVVLMYKSRRNRPICSRFHETWAENRGQKRLHVYKRDLYIATSTRRDRSTLKNHSQGAIVFVGKRAYLLYLSLYCLLMAGYFALSQNRFIFTSL